MNPAELLSAVLPEPLASPLVASSVPLAASPVALPVLLPSSGKQATSTQPAPHPLVSPVSIISSSTLIKHMFDV